MNVIGLVCARGGSKGLPGKNARELSGKSLIAHAVASAVAVKRIASVLVSTDSEELAQLARQEGGDVPFLRPEKLALDDSPEWDVWRHIVQHINAEGINCDALVVLPPTAPLRSALDIDRCLDVFQTGQFDIVITVTDASRSPYFNMVKSVGDGQAELVIRPDEVFIRRQDVPEVFDMTTVAYVARPEYVMSASGVFDGRVGYVYVPPERAIDIDTPLDYEFAQFLVNKRASAA